MKRFMHIALACACLPAITSCEKDLTPTVIEDARLNFTYYDYQNEEITNSESVKDEMKETSYSFALKSASLGEELQSDTVWFEVSTMGRLSDQNRPVELQQITTGENDAVPGVHYVPFDNAGLLSKSFVPAYSNRTQVPIVVLRDASLDEHNVALQFTFKDNGYFQPGYEAFATHTLIISTHLAKPVNWDTYYFDYSFGLYTELKHELMITWTGNNWDEAYLDELNSGDPGYINYLSQWFIEKLAEENQRRQEQGLDIHREPDGSPVSFEPIPWM